MRKVLLFILVGLLVFLLTGCAQLETQTSFDINRQGEMGITVGLRVDKLFGNQARTFVWGLTNAIPELQNNYSLTKATIDFSHNLYYTFQSKERISTEGHGNITFLQKDDGSYRFELKIPALLEEEVSESDKDTRAYKVSVTLPKEIDMANSKKVEGNTATWVIYYHELTTATTLKAFTK